MSLSFNCSFEEILVISFVLMKEIFGQCNEVVEIILLL